MRSNKTEGEVAAEKCADPIANEQRKQRDMKKLVFTYASITIFFTFHQTLHAKGRYADRTIDHGRFEHAGK